MIWVDALSLNLIYDLWIDLFWVFWYVLIDCFLCDFDMSGLIWLYLEFFWWAWIDFDKSGLCFFYSFVYSFFSLIILIILIADWVCSFGFEKNCFFVFDFGFSFLFWVLKLESDFNFSLWEEKAKMVIEWKQKRDWQWLWAS